MIVFKVCVRKGPHYLLVKRDWADLWRHLAGEFEDGNKDQLLNESRVKVKALGIVWNDGEVVFHENP